jgi:hypothetical protein
VDEKNNFPKSAKASTPHTQCRARVSPDLRTPQERLQSMMEQAAVLETRCLEYLYCGQRHKYERTAQEVIEARVRSCTLMRIASVGGYGALLWHTVYIIYPCTGPSMCTSQTGSLVMHNLFYKADLANAYVLGAVWGKALEHANSALQVCECTCIGNLFLKYVNI